MTEPTEDTVHNDRVWGAGRWVHCETCGAVHHVDYHRRGAGRCEKCAPWWTKARWHIGLAISHAGDWLGDRIGGRLP